MVVNQQLCSYCSVQPVCVCALLCFVVQMRGGSVCSRWLRPQMAKRSWEGEYNLLLCFKAVTDRVEMSTEGSL